MAGGSARPPQAHGGGHWSGGRQCQLAVYDRSFCKLHVNGLESFGQINVDLYLAAAVYLDGYDPEKVAYLTNVFSEGFRIESEGLEGECLRVDNPHLPVHLRPVLQKKLQKKLDAGRILGPFDEPPFPNLRVSPIKVAPKKTPGEYRFIHNLS